MLSLSVAAPAVEDDPYLQMLQQEALKVDSTGSEAPQGQASDNATGDIGVFENELKSHYRGSYLFYQKLPRSSQEEIFLEYKSGSSIEDIRKKIMNSFLQQK